MELSDIKTHIKTEIIDSDCTDNDALWKKFLSDIKTRIKAKMRDSDCEVLDVIKKEPVEIKVEDNYDSPLALLPTYQSLFEASGSGEGSTEKDNAVCNGNICNEKNLDRKKVVKWCTVPGCTNDIVSTPNKLFVHVPRKPKMRKKWFELAGRHPGSIGELSSVYFCEDHFDLPKDSRNYLMYKMGFSKRLMMEDGAVPSKFLCQKDRKERKCDVCLNSQPKP